MEKYELKRSIDRIVQARTEGQSTVRLGDITRHVEATLRTAWPRTADGINTMIVAQRLRMAGFRRTGFSGRGYDREPVYTRDLT